MEDDGRQVRRHENGTARHCQRARRRKTVVEGVFAWLDRLGFRRTRRRGLGRSKPRDRWPFGAFVHDVLKAKATGHMSRPHEDAGSCRSPGLPPAVRVVHALV